MNIIKTVGDLKKALSVYSDDLPFVIHDGSQFFNLNNDGQIAQLNYEPRFLEPSKLEIFLTHKN